MKRCSCGAFYTPLTWERLEYVGKQGEAPYELELRNCNKCGSTIAVAVNRKMVEPTEDVESTDED